MRIHIACSKIEHLRQSDEVVIVSNYSTTCPVAMLESSMIRTGMGWNGQRFLFRPIEKSKKEAVRESGCISYTCLRDLFKQFKDIGYQPDEFGLHSLRVGGTSAAAIARVSDSLFKDHGYWRSENVKDGHVEEKKKDYRSQKTWPVSGIQLQNTALFVYLVVLIKLAISWR